MSLGKEDLNPFTYFVNLLPFFKLLFLFFLLLFHAWHFCCFCVLSQSFLNHKTIKLINLQFVDEDILELLILLPTLLKCWGYRHLLPSLEANMFFMKNYVYVLTLIIKVLAYVGFNNRELQTSEIICTE